MEIGTLILNGFKILIDIVTVAMIVYIFWILLRALMEMTSNQQVRWDALLKQIAVLALGIILLRLYPTEVIKSIRISMENSRPEAQLLREEIKKWLPDVNDFKNNSENAVGSPESVRIISTSTPLAPTPTPSIVSTNEQGEYVPSETQTPYPTYTPYPTLTSTAIPPTPTYDPLMPPTPIVATAVNNSLIPPTPEK